MNIFTHISENSHPSCQVRTSHPITKTIQLFIHLLTTFMIDITLYWCIYFIGTLQTYKILDRRNLVVLSSAIQPNYPKITQILDHSENYWVAATLKRYEFDNVEIGRQDIDCSIRYAQLAEGNGNRRPDLSNFGESRYSVWSLLDQTTVVNLKNTEENKFRVKNLVCCAWC